MRKIVVATSIFMGLMVSASIVFSGTIRTEAQFREEIVEKKLVAGKAWITISENGTFSGRASKNEKITGRWVWSGRYWCRNAVVGTQKWQQDCQVIRIKGNTVIFIREKGKGLSAEWIIE